MCGHGAFLSLVTLWGNIAIAQLSINSCEACCCSLKHMHVQEVNDHVVQSKQINAVYDIRYV